MAVHFKNYELQDDDDIFSLGFVNSLFAMQLVMFVEKEFQLKVQDDDLLIDNFRSVNAVMDLVTKRGYRHELRDSTMLRRPSTGRNFAILCGRDRILTRTDGTATSACPRS